MPVSFNTAWEETIAAVATPDATASGGTFLIFFNVEGGTPVEVQAVANNSNTAYWALARMFLRAYPSGTIVDTVVSGLYAYGGYYAGGTVYAPMSVARISAFIRQVTLPAGTTYVALSLRADSNRTNSYVGRVYSPRSMAVLQLKR